MLQSYSIKRNRQVRIGAVFCSLYCVRLLPSSVNFCSRSKLWCVIFLRHAMHFLGKYIVNFTWEKAAVMWLWLISTSPQWRRVQRRREKNLHELGEECIIKKKQCQHQGGWRAMLVLDKTAAPLNHQVPWEN